MKTLRKWWQPITIDLHFNEIWKINCLCQDELLPRGSHLDFWLSEIADHRETRHSWGRKAVTWHRALLSVRTKLISCGQCPRVQRHSDALYLSTTLICDKFLNGSTLNLESKSTETLTLGNSLFPMFNKSNFLYQTPDYHKPRKIYACNPLKTAQETRENQTETQSQC